VNEIYKTMKALLDSTLGERVLSQDDPIALKLATLSARCEKMTIERRLLTARLRNQESIAAKETNRAREYADVISRLNSELETARTSANYYKLIIQTSRLPEDTAQEILKLREWVQVAYNSLHRAGPEFCREFEINLPWLVTEGQ